MEKNVYFIIFLGFIDLFEEFVVKCIQENFSDFVEFVVDYFNMLWLGRKKKDSKVSKEVLLFKLEKKESVEDKDELLEFLKMLVCG